MAIFKVNRRIFQSDGTLADEDMLIEAVHGPAASRIADQVQTSARVMYGHAVEVHNKPGTRKGGEK